MTKVTAAASVARPGIEPVTAIELTGFDLTLEDVWRVANEGSEAVLAPSATERMQVSRATIDELVASEQVVYGVTTGFGDLASHPISARCGPSAAARICWRARFTDK